MMTDDPYLCFPKMQIVVLLNLLPPDSWCDQMVLFGMCEIES